MGEVAERLRRARLVVPASVHMSDREVEREAARIELRGLTRMSLKLKKRGWARPAGSRQRRKSFERAAACDERIMALAREFDL